MKQAVSLTSKEQSEFFRYKPELELVDLTASEADPVVICRTCQFDHKRLWGVTIGEVAVHVRKGGDPKDLECAPSKEFTTVRVLNQTDWRNRIVPLDTETSVPTRGLLTTCGQKLRGDCATCDRFVAKTVTVAYSQNPDAKVHWIARPEGEGHKVKTFPVSSDGTTPKLWRVTVGGHCSIPAEGIKINGETKYCDHVPRAKRVENPSCANCYYLDYKGDNWQSDYLEVNANAALTPYERERALLNDVENNPGKALGMALWAKQSEPYGRRTIHTATIMEAKTEVMSNGMKKYFVILDDNLLVAAIAEDDDRFQLTVLAGNKCYLNILWPYHKMLHLRPKDRKPVYSWPPMPRSVLRDFTELNSHLVAPQCHECRQPTDARPGKPCYFHAKGPAIDPFTREVIFTKAGNQMMVWETPPQARMKLSTHITERGLEPVAVDGQGRRPETFGTEVANVTVFRHHLRSLLNDAYQRYGHDGYMAILRQYINLTKSLIPGKRERNFRPSWLRISSIEPNKPTCSHPGGIDMRKVFQDSFGSERVDWEFDHGEFNTMAVDEEWRVGFRQHAQTPQRLQEEILSTDQAHPRFDAAIGGVWPLDEPIELPPYREYHGEEAIGGMYIDGRPVTDPREFQDRLDELVTVGEAGAVERKMTRRQQLYGYELSRGYYGSRKGSEKTSMPAADPGFVIFDTTEEPDQVDLDDAWRCPECDSTYENTDLEDFFNPVCDCGSALYKDHLRVTSNPRGRGGIGNAFAMDTQAMQERRRLSSTVCPNWRLNTGSSGTIIGLDDVMGPKRTRVVSETKVSVGPKIYKVGTLTDEHKAANAAYQKLLDDVVSHRETYAKENPGTSAEELVKLFPAPTGTIYQVKAAGSLSKMGGV